MDWDDVDGLWLQDAQGLEAGQQLLYLLGCLLVRQHPDRPGRVGERVRERLAQLQGLLTRVQGADEVLDVSIVLFRWHHQQTGVLVGENGVVLGFALLLLFLLDGLVFEELLFGDEPLIDMVIEDLRVVGIGPVTEDPFMRVNPPLLAIHASHNIVSPAQFYLQGNAIGPQHIDLIDILVPLGRELQVVKHIDSLGADGDAETEPKELVCYRGGIGVERAGVCVHGDLLYRVVAGWPDCLQGQLYLLMALGNLLHTVVLDPHSTQMTFLSLSPDDDNPTSEIADRIGSPLQSNFLPFGPQVDNNRDIRVGIEDGPALDENPGTAYALRVLKDQLILQQLSEKFVCLRLGALQEGQIFI